MLRERDHASHVSYKRLETQCSSKNTGIAQWLGILLLPLCPGFNSWQAPADDSLWPSSIGWYKKKKKKKNLDDWHKIKFARQ